MKHAHWKLWRDRRIIAGFQESPEVRQSLEIGSSLALAQAVYNERTALHLTHAQYGAHVEMTEENVEHLEGGAIEPTVEMLAQLSAAAVGTADMAALRQAWEQHERRGYTLGQVIAHACGDERQQDVDDDGPASWVRHLPPDDRELFEVEMRGAVRVAHGLGDDAALRQTIIEWKHTAEIHADPETRAAVISGDCGPVPEPGAPADMEPEATVYRRARRGWDRSAGE